MFAPTVVICILALIGCVHGFRPISINRARSKISVVVPDDDERTSHKRTEGKNWFQQLLHAFLQTIPEVLRPPREMDSTKVIYDPPAFDKPSDYGNSRKMHRKKVDAVDHFLERYQTESVLLPDQPSLSVRSIVKVEVRQLNPEIVYRNFDKNLIQSEGSDSKTTNSALGQKSIRKSLVQSETTPFTVADESKTVYWPLKKMRTGENVLQSKTANSALGQKSIRKSLVQSETTPFTVADESKTVYWPLKKMRTGENVLQSKTAPFTSIISEPKTVYWPLKKQIINHDIPLNFMRRPHDLNTALRDN